MEISRCKYCYDEGMLTENNLGRWYVECTNIDCMCTSPCKGAQEEAILVWNGMMSPPITAVLDNTSTDYRDRIDKMVAALIISEVPKGGFGEHLFATQAMAYVGAIDKAIAEKENNK